MKRLIEKKREKGRHTFSKQQRMSTTIAHVFLVVLLNLCASSIGLSGTSTFTGSNLTTRSISPRALSGSFCAATGSSYYNGCIDWSATQDASAWTSTITAKFYIKKIAASSYRTYDNYDPPYSITIGGTTYSGTQSFDFAANCAIGTIQTLGTASKAVSHNSDGSISAVNISGSFESAIGWGTVTVSGSVSPDKITLSVSVTYSGNGGSPSTTTRTVTYYGTYGTLPTVTRTGYSFTGWYTSSSGGSTVTAGTTVTSKSAHTLYAHWSVNPYTISFVTNGGSSCNSITQNYGTTVTLPSTSKTGYRFNYWCSDSGLTTKYTGTTMPAGSITLYAKFTINPYTISFVTNGGSTCSSITQNYGTTVTLPSTTKTGYTFDYWCSDSGLTTKYTDTTMPAKSITLYAKFTINQYTISFVTNGGSSCDSITQDYGTTVTLPDTSKTGYTFDYWCSDSGLTTRFTDTTMPAGSITLYAKWTINNYTMTFAYENGTVIDSHIQVYNSTVDFPTVEKEGHTFIGWYMGNNPVNFTRVPITNTTFYAKFTVNSYNITIMYDENKDVMKEFKYGDVINLTSLANEVLNEYEVLGWYTDAEYTNKIESNSITVPAYNIELYPYIISNRVEIVIEGNKLKKKDVKNIIKKYTDAEFVIEEIKPIQGDTIVIIRFNDVEGAREFIETVEGVPESSNTIKKITFCFSSLDSFSSTFHILIACMYLIL